MSQSQDAIPQLSRGESVEVAQKDGESASGEALPEGWAWATLKEIVNSITYGHTASASYEPVGPRFLRITDIQGGRVDWDSVPFCECDDVEKYALKNGDIVIARTGATTGKNFLIGDLSEPSVFASYLIRLETLEDLSAEFLSDFMQTPHYWQQITTVSKGSAQPGANATILSKLAIPVAPKAEQSRIVSAIESLQERSARARGLLSEVGPLIGQLRQSVLRDAFSGKLTADWRARRRMGTPESPSPPAPSEENSGLGAPVKESATNPAQETASELLLRIRTERRERWQSEQLAKYEAKGKQPPKNWQDKYKEPEPVDESELPELPDGWCWASIGQLTLIDSGDAFKKKDYSDSGFRLFQIANVSFGKTLWEQQNYLPEKFGESHKDLILDTTDILIALNRPILNGQLKVTRVTESDLPAILYQRVGRLRTAIPDITEYLFAFMLGPTMLKQVEANLQGSDQPYINTSDIPKIAVPLAPLEEQTEIVRMANEAVEIMESQLAGLASMESSLTQLDQSILSKAFRGELVPQDPTEEPASELLMRIRNTREKLEAEKKATKAKRKATKKKNKKPSKKGT